MTQAAVNRLRWRCRRGLLELDTWLASFLEAGYPHLTPAEKDAFGRLLEREDMEIYAWLSGRQAPPRAFAAVVQRLSACKMRTP